MYAKETTNDLFILHILILVNLPYLGNFNINNGECVMKKLRTGPVHKTKRSLVVDGSILKLVHDICATIQIILYQRNDTEYCFIV